MKSERNKIMLPYLDPPYIIPPVDLCACGRGGKGGAFVPALVVEESILLGLHELRRAFGLAPAAPNGSRDGESNETELDLAFIPTPSQGFGGADITLHLIAIRKCQRCDAIFNPFQSKMATSH